VVAEYILLFYSIIVVRICQ